MRVSVGMATHNSARWLGTLLDSLARQTSPPHELVVCDDASEDGTPEMVGSFAESAPFPVRLIRNASRRGHVDSFLRAAEACSGDLVALCDHDDVWLADKLAVCGRLLGESGAVLALHSVRVVDEELVEVAEPWPRIPATRVVPPLSLTGYELDAPGMAMVFRRWLLDAAPRDARPPSRYLPGERMLHDEWLFMLANVCGSIQLIAEPLLLYRQHGANHYGYTARQRDASLTPAVETYRRVADLSRATADYLAAAEPADPGLDARFAAGARHHRRAATRWALRAALYESAGRRARAAALGRLLRSRAYGARDAGGFGRQALGKDVVAGLILARKPG